MNIGIIGGGMVGNAVANGFQLNQNHILISDPSINDISIDEVCNHSEVIFICVPTPTIDGEFDSTIIDEVMHKVYSMYKGDVIIKSTIIPDSLIDLYENCPPYINLAYNPEFLTDRTANNDFVFPHLVVIGTEDKDYANRIESLYKNHSRVKCENYHKVDLIGASMFKYGLNTFFATKVIFMNELYGVFKESGTGIEWEDFRKLMGSHPWVGASHNQVPGHDGYFGYGGKCFPKDTKAFSKYANRRGKPSHLLNKAMELNEKYRNE